MREEYCILSSTWDTCTTSFPAIYGARDSTSYYGYIQLKSVMLCSAVDDWCYDRVAGLGGFRFVDLDTPMLLAEDPFTGGYEQRGGVYDVSGVKRGLGIERR
jgi:hypothetical protein